MSLSRFAGEWPLLARLAEWLRAQRAGRYPELIARGHLDEAGAFRDNAAREAVALDWCALADRAPRQAGPDAPTAWKIETLRAALAGAQARLDALAPGDPARPDHADLRDAVAHLLACYESGFTTILLLDQAARRAREPAAPAAKAAA